MTDRLMTLLEFSKYIAVSTRTARRIVARGEVPIVRIGASMRVRQSDVEKYLEAHRIELSTERDFLKTLVAKAVERARARRAS